MAKHHSKKDSIVLDTPAQMKALAEPLRYRVFELLTREARTAKQMAVQMGLKPTRLYHHFGVLEKAGLIQQIKTRKKRGTTEKYYETVANRVVLDPNMLGSRILSPGSLVAGVFQATLEEIIDAEQAVADASQEPAILVNQLKIRTSLDNVQVLQDKLQEWIRLCESASGTEGDAEYGITVAFYPIISTVLEDE